MCTAPGAGGDWENKTILMSLGVRTNGDLVCRDVLDVFTESAITLFGFDLERFGRRLTDVH